MSREAVANQTFHYVGGTVPGGSVYDSEDEIVKTFPTFFDIQAEDAPVRVQDHYEEQPINDLRAVAKGRSIDASGSKAELIARLREADRES